MEKVVVKGKIEFYLDDAKEFNSEFKATLQDSPAFEYGNGTCVTIIFTNKMQQKRFIDTRYDKSISKSTDEGKFKEWLCNYFFNNFTSHHVEFYDKEV